MNKFLKWVIEQFTKNRGQLPRYMFWGAITAGLNLAIYLLLANLLNVHYVIANIITWVVYVIASYLCNAFFVFDQRKLGLKRLLRGQFEFALSRGFTAVLETCLLALFVSGFGFDKNIVKIGVSVVSALTNYFISKFVVFGAKRR